jgi:hypothetical protein
LFAVCSRASRPIGRHFGLTRDFGYIHFELEEPPMSESSPFIRDFVFSLSDSTRRDLIAHLIMDRIGSDGLKDVSGNRRQEQMSIRYMINISRLTLSKSLRAEELY